MEADLDSHQDMIYMRWEGEGKVTRKVIEVCPTLSLFLAIGKERANTHTHISEAERNHSLI